ncbi:MAG: Nif3-like dinuclear metal center hexameric protein [Candidatus Omnitrophica bacterium]|nr:Nif3-like dinuclear metal center hexameric protein [Candidatus Omnitrophota bacterium]
MKLNEIYQFFIAQGMVEDLRTQTQIRKKLSLAKREYHKLKGLQKKFFDKENLVNPYADTRILFGDLNTEVKHVLVGIDIGVDEILLADRLSSKNKKIDLVISHHPLGIALAGLYEVMEIQTTLLSSLGVKQEIAEKLMKERTDQVERSLHSANHLRVVDAARQIKMPLMCCHTPADNHVAQYLQRIMNKQKPKTLENVVNLLLKEPEYRQASCYKAGPKILVGDLKSKAGKIVLDMTGGTEGSDDVFARLSQAGVNTLLGMHVSERHFKKIKSEHLNVIIAGHIASDNLGLNLLFDKLEKKAKTIEFVECSGFKRVRR